MRGLNFLFLEGSFVLIKGLVILFDSAQEILRECVWVVLKHFGRFADGEDLASVVLVQVDVSALHTELRVSHQLMLRVRMIRLLKDCGMSVDIFCF